MAKRKISYRPIEELQRLEQLLLGNMKRQASQMRTLLEEINGHWAYEDGLYRFYHNSFKVFALQSQTEKIVAALTAIAPEAHPFCDTFGQVIQAGTGRTFKMEDNQHWVESTGPIVQAYLHARYFLEMAVKYSPLEEPTQPMPSGWAALLCLYRIR